MIIGLGSDVTDINRIEKALARFGERFEKRIFSEGEIRKARSRRKAGEKQVAATYAKRFAAKEACAKALGTGVPRAGVHWRDMEVVNLASGKPTMRLYHGAMQVLEAITPAGSTVQIDLSMSDDYPTAQATVIISANSL